MLPDMSYFLYQLSFDGPVHFGDTSLGGGLEQAGWTYTSDTLFSSVCTELAGQGEYKLLDDFISMALEGKILLSDLFPYQLADGDEPQLFLPVPYIYLENNRKHVSLTLEEAKIMSARRKKSKKQLYCRVSELQPYCDSLRAGMQYEPAAVMELGNEFITTKVNCRGEQPLPYFVKGNVFQPGVGLYIIARLPDDFGEMFQNILCSLGLSGIGGKRSSGFGRFHLQDDGLVLEDAYDWYVDTKALHTMLTGEHKRYMCISSVLPSADELNATKAGMYKLRKSSGFSEGVKRDSVYMLEAGSCFDRRLQGQLVNLGEQAGHPVWRYGRGLYVGLDI